MKSLAWAKAANIHKRVKTGSESSYVWLSDPVVNTGEDEGLCEGLMEKGYLRWNAWNPTVQKMATIGGGV
jgi:hypothetical protein